MAINGVKPGSQTIGDSNECIVSEPVSTGKMNQTTTTTKSVPQTTQAIQIGNDTSDEQLEKKLRDALNMVNNKMKQQQSRTRCEYTVHNDINRISIKIVNNDTQEVVKEIPSESTIKSIEKLWEISGLLVDKKL